MTHYVNNIFSIKEISICKSCFWCASFLKLKAIVTSDLEKFTDDSVALAMKHIFSRLEINELDLVDGLKQLLYEKKYDMNTILQSDPVSLADELGIEEYVSKIIIDPAKRKLLE